MYINEIKQGFEKYKEQYEDTVAYIINDVEILTYLKQVALVNQRRQGVSLTELGRLITEHDDLLCRSPSALLEFDGENYTTVIKKLDSELGCDRMSAGTSRCVDMIYKLAREYDSKDTDNFHSLVTEAYRLYNSGYKLETIAEIFRNADRCKKCLYFDDIGFQEEPILIEKYERSIYAHDLDTYLQDFKPKEIWIYDEIKIDSNSTANDVIKKMAGIRKLEVEKILSSISNTSNSAETSDADNKVLQEVERRLKYLPESIKVSTPIEELLKML